MPVLQTKYFGLIEYREEEIVQFPSGLPGFEEESHFLMLEPPADAPLVFLQSVRVPALCFLALPMLAVDPDYQLAVAGEDLATLGLATGRQPRSSGEVRCYTLIVVGGNGQISANLLAPLLINPANGRGVQAIRFDSLYSHQHLLTEVVCS
jgi:flagellar assembly factor FliW